MRRSRELRLAKRVIISALEDRIKLLIKKYPKVDEKIIRDTVLIDPTDKGDFIEWIVNRINKGEIQWPEQRLLVSKVLLTYKDIKKSLTMLRKFNVKSDVSQYSLNDLIEIHDQVLEWGESVLGAVEVVYNKPPYKVIKISADKVGVDPAIEAACTYARGTKWCTKDQEQSRKYIEDGPLYVIFEGGHKIAQSDQDGEEVMDNENDVISFRDNLRLYEVMAMAGIISKGKFNYDLVIKMGGGQRSPHLEQEIIKDPYYAAQYAIDVLHGRWPEAEESIAKDGMAAYLYAYWILKSRWGEAEPAIMQISNVAGDYANAVIKGRWPEAEEIIGSDPYSAYYYAKRILNGRWPEKEHIIIKDPYTAYQYATEVMKEPWPEAEPYIKRSAYWWNRYLNFLGGSKDQNINFNH